MLKKILVGLSAAVVLLVLVGLLLPQTAELRRSIVIKASPSTVYTVLNGYQQFNKWSPWADIDPDATTTLSGPEAGVGARMEWSGNDEVGTGSQEIIETTPYSSIKQRLSFGDFPGQYFSSFELRDTGEGTEVTWEYRADYEGNLLLRYFGLFTGPMLGPDYEKGLARLKQLVEAMPGGDFSALEFSTVEAEPVPVVMTSVHAEDNPSAIGVALGVAYSRLAGFIQAQGLSQVAPPVAIFKGQQQGTLAIEAAIPVAPGAVPAADGVRGGELPGGRLVRAEYRGAYTGLGGARRQLLAYAAAAGLSVAGPLWEQYVSDPAQTPESQLVTHLFAPIR